VEAAASDHDVKQLNPRTRQPLDERANMLPSARPIRRAVNLAIGAGALAGAILCGAAATAAAQPEPEPPAPPPCTAAELARVMSGVTFDTSNYLTAHPDVNDFFTSLKGQPRDQISAQVQSYLDANPGVRDDLQRIRQPSVDFRQRCGAPATP
jgi:hemophore-related protein